MNFATAQVSLAGSTLKGSTKDFRKPHKKKGNNSNRARVRASSNSNLTGRLKGNVASVYAGNATDGNTKDTCKAVNLNKAPKMGRSDVTSRNRPVMLKILPKPHLITYELVSCPQCSIAMERGYYYHKGCSKRSDIYEDRVMVYPRAAPAVVLTCPTCLREYSRWCDQDKDKKKKAGCEIHPRELCYWTQSRKSGKWVLICYMCRSKDATSSKKKLPGAKRGRCSHCGAPSFQYNSTRFGENGIVDGCNIKRPGADTLWGHRKNLRQEELKQLNRLVEQDFKNLQSPDSKDRKAVAAAVAVSMIATSINASKARVTNTQLEAFADSCRKDIGEWIQRAQPTGRGSTMVWRGELAKLLVRHTVLGTGEWRQVMLAAKPELQRKYPHIAGDIHHTIQQYLVRSPMEAFLKANAYKWLQYLEYIRGYPSWYPHLAIEVAHTVFRLKGRIETFMRYLNHPARRRRLRSLHIPVEDDSFLNSPRKAAAKIRKGAQKKPSEKQKQDERHNPKRKADQMSMHTTLHPAPSHNASTQAFRESASSIRDVDMRHASKQRGNTEERFRGQNRTDLSSNGDDTGSHAGPQPMSGGDFAARVLLNLFSSSRNEF